jgi:hypothetical protein
MQYSPTTICFHSARIGSDGVELLILDNRSSLTVGVRENDGDAWAQIQDWLLRLRRRGISVLIIHHTGKHGGQRGTSRREDVLDTSFSLRQPSDYTIDQGARFEVHIEKGRGPRRRSRPAVRGAVRSHRRQGLMDREGRGGGRARPGRRAAGGRDVGARDRRGDRGDQIGGAPHEAAARAGGEGGGGRRGGRPGRRRIGEAPAAVSLSAR